MTVRYRLSIYSLWAFTEIATLGSRPGGALARTIKTLLVIPRKGELTLQILVTSLFLDNPVALLNRLRWASS